MPEGGGGDGGDCTSERAALQEGLEKGLSPNVIRLLRADLEECQVG